MFCWEAARELRFYVRVTRRCDDINEVHDSWRYYQAGVSGLEGAYGSIWTVGRRAVRYYRFWGITDSASSLLRGEALSVCIYYG